MDWKALFRPMKETAEREVKAAVDRLIRTPRPEDIASPLREELKGLMGAKQDVGYAEHCANCRGHQTLDQGVADAVESKEDPTPRLEQVESHVSPRSLTRWIIGSAIAGFAGKGLLDLALWLVPKLLGIG
jgi:hypothetical protein